MKNNVIKFLTITACILVWVAVYFVLFGSKDAPIASQKTSMIDLDIEPIKDFELLLNYSDPFLNGSVRKKKKIISYVPPPPIIRNHSVSKSMLEAKANAVKKEKPKPKKPVVFPSIAYNGYVKQKSGSRSASVNVLIEGKMYNWDKNEKIKEMSLVKIHYDSIRVRYQNEYKTFKRNNL